MGLHVKLVVACRECSEDCKARALSYLIASWNYHEARISTSGEVETRFLPIKQHFVAGFSGDLEGSPLCSGQLPKSPSVAHKVAEDSCSSGLTARAGDQQHQRKDWQQAFPLKHLINIFMGRWRALLTEYLILSGVQSITKRQ
jgi:hypothetical protein